MALSDCDISLTVTTSSVAHGTEIVTDDDHEIDNDENYLNSFFPDDDRHARSCHVSVNTFIKHATVAPIAQDLNGSNFTALQRPSLAYKRQAQNKKPSKTIVKDIHSTRTRRGHSHSVTNLINSESLYTLSETRISPASQCTVKVLQNSDSKGDSVNSSEIETTLLYVAPLKVSECKKDQSAIKTTSKSTVHEAAVTSATVPAIRSTLLSIMAHAFSTPKYTQGHTYGSSISVCPACPTRDSWPLLREMIAKPAVSVVSMSSAPRKSLSIVQTELVDEQPSTDAICKFERQIKCECKFNRGQPCWFLFPEDRLRKERLHHLTMKRESLDLVILAKIAANMNRDEKTKKHQGQERQRCRICYYHEGRQICRETFMFIHGICKGRLCALMQHYKKKGLSTRVHGNKSSIPHHALSNQDSQRVVDFIREYANNHSLSAFGRKPGSQAGRGLLIMSPTQSKLYVHHRYKIWCSKHKHRVVSLRSFQNLWTKHLPYIIALRSSHQIPIVEQGLHRSVPEWYKKVHYEDEIQTKAVTENESQAHIGSNRVNADDALRAMEVQADGFVKLGQCHSSTQVDFDCVPEAEISRKRKSLLPQKTELLEVSPDTKCEHQQISDGMELKGPVKHNDSQCSDSESDIDSGSGVQDTVPPVVEMHHSLLNSGRFHVPHTTNNSSFENQSTATISFHNKPAAAVQPVMMSADKVMVYTCHSKPSLSMTSGANLHPPAHLSQTLQLLDSFILPCDTDRLTSELSDSTGLCGPQQSMFFPHQGLDLPNLQPLEWQMWPSYSSTL